MSEPIVGIDFGTTWNLWIPVSGELQVIKNSDGAIITPSYVLLDGDKVVVGKTAKEEVQFSGGLVIYDAKRIIGRRFDEIENGDQENWPFKVIDCNGKAKYEVVVKGKTTYYLPDEISAYVLQKLATMAIESICHPFRKAVITVPAYFTHRQRVATIYAGQIPGLQVVSIINELLRQPWSSEYTRILSFRLSLYGTISQDKTWSFQIIHIIVGTGQNPMTNDNDKNGPMVRQTP